MIFNPFVVQSGGGGTVVDVPSKEVNFYDYDGRILYAYTVEEMQGLSALPEPPAHDGLTCQGWNWSLADLKATNRPMNVGAMYITDDGKTRLYIKIISEKTLSVPLYIYQSIASGVVIDWGDGTETTTLPSTGFVNTTHNYSGVGEYVISLDPVAGWMGFGNMMMGYGLMGITGGSNQLYLSTLWKVEIGRNVSTLWSNVFSGCSRLTSISLPASLTGIDMNAFSFCYSLSFIVIPSGLTSLAGSPSYIFQYCYSLYSISIPNAVTNMGVGTFSRCYALSSVPIPSGVTSIGDSTFSDCPSLSSIAIPSTVMNIGSYAFSNCPSMALYDFSNHTSVPTLSNTNAFTGIPSDCVIKVPAALESEWKVATNWATYADYIVGV